LIIDQITQTYGWGCEKTTDWETDRSTLESRAGDISTEPRGVGLLVYKYLRGEHGVMEADVSLLFSGIERKLVLHRKNIQ
jgi:hypothetical protein